MFSSSRSRPPRASSREWKSGSLSGQAQASPAKVIYLYRLVKEISDNSLGIFCARLAGLSDSIVQRAYQILMLRSDLEGTGRIEVLDGIAGNIEANIEDKLARFLNLDLSPSSDFSVVRQFLQTIKT